MKLLAYGSLKKGHYNHKLLRDSEFLYETTVPGYTLYSAGSYPVAIKSEIEGHEITGEVYEIDGEIWGIVNNMERYAGYKSELYKDVVFFVYQNWLRAVTKFEHIGSTWK